MTNNQRKDNFTDVVQIVQTPKPTPPVTPKPVQQVTAVDGTVVTLSNNTKKPN
jgi:hypothetical protein